MLFQGTLERLAFGDMGLMLASRNKYCSRRNCAKTVGDGAHMVECLLSLCEALGSIPQHSVK